MSPGLTELLFLLNLAFPQLTRADVTQENMIRDFVKPVILEEVSQIKLRITIQPGESTIFMKGSVLGLSCDANSEIDNNVTFSWTKNGKFIDTTTGHVAFESLNDGNIIIFSAGLEDEGLYQCSASNSEGVVFSKVSKVRLRKSPSGSRERESGGRSLPASSLDGARQSGSRSLPSSPLDGAKGPASPLPYMLGVWLVYPQPEFPEEEDLMVVLSE